MLVRFWLQLTPAAGKSPEGVPDVLFSAPPCYLLHCLLGQVEGGTEVEERVLLGQLRWQHCGGGLQVKRLISTLHAGA